MCYKNRINHQRWTSFSLRLPFIWPRNFPILEGVYVHLLLQSLQLNKLPTISKKLQQCKALPACIMTVTEDTTFSSSSNEIFFGLYASKGPVLDRAFVVLMISHSWSSFTFATSLLNHKDQLLLSEETVVHLYVNCIACETFFFFFGRLGKRSFSFCIGYNQETGAA